ncbi:APC family permease [Desulfopila inferna]|uniref:APC family permease n=1 Tax=Desulfopila inferna TaxID=468528 RepID=UPI00196385A1|nr:amino acid permease [Desulfopila inferna]MBM9603707.1 amino acid permease [Desulfopila inferna]
MDHLQRKYGFWTATAMVVGIVIGSGVFFKADDVLRASGGSLPTALLAWAIGGSIMIVTAYVFANIGARIEKINGVVDYFEEAYGEKGGYLVAWFMTFIYYPTLVAVLAWVSANYSIGLLGLEKGVWLLASLYLIFFFLLNLLSPILAGMWQVSTTLIKLVPLGLVAVIGGISGILSGQTMDSFVRSAEGISEGGGLAVATLATAFAYEGWIIATSINAEIKNAKKTLPKALVTGTMIVAAVYMLYYLGISGVLSNEQVIAAGDNAPVQVISLIFGRIGGTLLTVFVVISCLGTLNGLIMGSVRGMFAIAIRGLGPRPEFFRAVNIRTNSTLNSGILGFLLSSFWLMVWYGNFAGWWGSFMDISELPIAFLYVIYIAIYIWVIRSFTDLGPFARFGAPFFAGCGSLYIIWGAIQKDMFAHFFVITLAIASIGYVLMRQSSDPQAPGGGRKKSRL